MLGQDADGAHHCLANIKVPGPADEPVDEGVHLAAEHLVQRLEVARLGHAVPGQHQLSVGALEHCRGHNRKAASAVLPRSGS